MKKTARVEDMAETVDELFSVARALPNYKRLSSLSISIEDGTVTLDAMFDTDEVQT